MVYRKEIDGLRALAVVPVILFHAGYDTFSGGFIGVDVFFVISGYLITNILISEISNNRFSFVNFYFRRARRIIPVLFNAILLSIPASYYFLNPREMIDFAESIISTITFSSNILFWQEIGYFNTKSELKPLIHTWSLSVEEQYYLIFPLVTLIALGFGRKYFISLVITVLFVSIVLAEWGSNNTPDAAFYLLPTRAWEIMIGSLCAIIIYYRLFGSYDKSLIFNNIFSFLGLFLIIYSVLFFDRYVKSPGIMMLVPTIGTALIILFSQKMTIVTRILSISPFVYIGLLSYSLYIYHQPVFAFARYYHSDDFINNALYYIFLITLISAISYKVIENPIRNRSILKGARAFKCYIAFATLFFISFSLIAFLSKGNIFRFDSNITREFENVPDWNKYVWELKIKYRLSDYGDKKEKVLIIGDSNSGDFFNAIYDIYGDRLGYSSITVQSGCGNLFIKQEIIVEKRVRSYERCIDSDNLTNEKEMRLIEKADIVFIASSWKKWETELIAESHRELVRIYGDKFYYFGSKHIDVREMDIYRSAEKGHYADLHYPALPESVRINEEISEIIGKQHFIDPYDIMCDAIETCQVVNGSGSLLFYDGFHLSKNGAARLGRGLKERLKTIIK